MVVSDKSYCKCWHSRLGPPQTLSSRVGQGTRLHTEVGEERGGGGVPENHLQHPPGLAASLEARGLLGKSQEERTRGECGGWLEKGTGFH